MENRKPGWDKAAIAEIARDEFGGMDAMFQHFGWDADAGKSTSQVAPTCIAETCGSVEGFVRHAEYALQPSKHPLDYWTDETAVLLTSFWGWDPEKWGKLGWSKQGGLTRLKSLRHQLTDPFFGLVYVTDHTSNGLRI